MIQRHISTSEESRRRFAQITRETLQSHGSIVQHALHDIMQLQSCHVEQPLGIGHPVDQPTGHGSRRFERRMRHHVGDARILVVTDAGDDGQRKLRDISAQPITVETSQIAARTAPANQHHGVEIRLPVGHLAQSRDDGILGGSPLHESIEQLRFKTVRALGQLLAEVLITGGLRTRHDGYALHDLGHGQRTVHLPHTVLLQLRNGLLPLPFEIAHGERRVDVGDLQRKTVQLVVRDQHFGQQPDTGDEPLSRLDFETGRDARKLIAPDDRPSLCRGQAVVRPLFDQFEVTMS